MREWLNLNDNVFQLNAPDEWDEPIHIPAFYGASSLGILVPRDLLFTYDDSHNEIYYWQDGEPQMVGHEAPIYREIANAWK